MILYFSHSAFTKFCTMIFKWMIKHYQHSFKWTLTHRIDYISTFTVVCKTECASFMVYIFRDHVEKLGSIHNAYFNYFKNLYFSLIRANACSPIFERELDKNIWHVCWIIWVMWIITVCSCRRFSMMVADGLAPVRCQDICNHYDGIG